MPASGPDPVRIGIISFAHMHAWGYAQALRRLPEAELAGLWDADAARAQRMAEALGSPGQPVRIYGSLEALLDDDLQAVVVCTENALHKDAVIAAARADKHVLCEKPLATTLADAREMVDACLAGGVQLMTSFPCRYAPAYQEARRLVRSGGLGEVLAIKGTNRGRNPGGWFVDPALSGGGSVMDHTVHVVDLMRDLTGDEVVEVYAETDTVFQPDLPCEDTGLVTVEFRNGCIGTNDCSWSRPPHYPIWGDVTLCVVGTGGNAWVDLVIEHVWVWRQGDRSVAWEMYGESLDLLLMRDFVGCVATGQTVPITGEDGARALEVALAAYRSAETATPVRLPLA